MNSRLLRQVLAMFLFVAADCASAQTSTDIIDSQKPPAGFIAPKPAEARDLSMAKYARQSYLAGEEGVVTLRVLVRRDGSVGDVQIATSSGSARLDQSAQDVVGDWRYQPATVNGAPVDSWVPVNIIWALQTLRFEFPVEQVRNLGAYYPQASLRSGETGTSTVRFLVSPDGTITKAIIEKSSGHPRLDDATVVMLKSAFHFVPSTLPTGETAGTWFRLKFTWALPGQRSKDDACFARDGTSSADAVILACTQFLTDPNLNGFERALAYEQRGSAHRSKHEFDQAIADYDSGIRISPGLSELHVGRARAHLAKGETDLAFSDFDSGVYVEPLSYEAYIARAEAYFKTGQQDRAAADLDRAMRIAPTPDQPGAYNARCLYFIGIGKPQDALADCNKSLTLRPKVSQFLDSRGIAYLKLGQYERAIQDYDAALQINARLAPALYGRGIAKLKRGDAKGESDLKAAKAIDPLIGEQMAELGVMP